MLFFFFNQVIIFFFPKSIRIHTLSPFLIVNRLILQISTWHKWHIHINSIYGPGCGITIKHPCVPDPVSLIGTHACTADHYWSMPPVLCSTKYNTLLGQKAYKRLAERQKEFLKKNHAAFVLILIPCNVYNWRRYIFNIW